VNGATHVDEKSRNDSKQNPRRVAPFGLVRAVDASQLYERVAIENRWRVGARRRAIAIAPHDPATRVGTLCP
jgi:hypothetical protein